MHSTTSWKAGAVPLNTSAKKQDAGAVGKYERSLRELLRKHQPPYPTAKR